MEISISIDQPKNKFYEHLTLETNNRIIFSGKFGTGKSHFLREFFKDKEFKDKYNVFWISPVNYVVGANKDIFEWIKVDIGKELLVNHTFEEGYPGFSKNFLIQNYISQNIGDIFNTLLKSAANELIKKKTGISFLDTFPKYAEEFKKFKENIEGESKSDKAKIIDKITSSTSETGSIFEDNTTTQIIRAKIELLNFESKKESVLIIDDLDRLDPEHIFRILNILSCHNDHFESNKFGFNKVILVCDINNIEFIYKHKYGDKVDFFGYIEKFYTYEPFHYSLKETILYYCKNSLSLNGIDESSELTLSLLLTILLNENLLKIRNLKKILSGQNFSLDKFNTKKYEINIEKAGNNNFMTFIDSNIIEVDLNKFNFLKILNIIVISVGGIDNFKSVLKSIKRINDSIDYFYHEHLFNSMSILFALSKRQTHGDSNVFYDNTNTHYTNYRQFLKEPTIKFLNTDIALKLQWNKSNQYVNGHYFDGVNLNTNSNRTDIRAGMLIQELNAIIDFAISENIFNNMKD